MTFLRRAVSLISLRSLAACSDSFSCAHHAAAASLARCTSQFNNIVHTPTALHSLRSRCWPNKFTKCFSSLEAEATSAATSATAQVEPTTYLIEVVTGDVRGAGCASPAVITLFGEDGRSESHVVGAEEDNSGFERATRKSYAIYSKDLGPLKRVLVQQLDPNLTDASGWYLDRIEVRGPHGKFWTFPCGGWLGRSGDVSGCNERNLIPADHHRDVYRSSSSLHDPSNAITRPLMTEASGYSIPHPEKVSAGAKGENKKGFGHSGEDAFFFASNSNGIYALGVADGVYEWRTVGVDAGEFSKALMEYCRQGIELGKTDVLRVLQFASRHVSRAGIKGSSTICLALVDTLQGRLAAANIGDSGLILLGYAPGSYKSTTGRGELQVRYRSPQQEHAFGHPYQLGHHTTADSPDDAMLFTVPIYPGDCLILGSDGLFDNLHDEEIIETVDRAMTEGAPPSAVSQALVFQAFQASIDKRRTTPYSIAASEAFDMVYNGGKPDDITAVVCLIE